VAKTYEFEFDAPTEQLFTEALSAVRALGFSILHEDEGENEATAIIFNTGPSMWSTAGQDMTATAVALSPSSSKLVVGGKTARKGSEAQYGSWGERGRIAKGLATRVGRALADSITDAAEHATSNGAAFVAELATLAELHRSGALTDGEFAKAKERLLAGLPTT
jgi:Short C-terminal domain